MRDIGGTVYESFAASTARWAKRPFLYVTAGTAAAYGIEQHEYAYEEVAGEVERLRTIYAAAGYGHGHRAGLLLFNRPEFLFHWLALNALGVSVVPVNPEWRSDELAYLVGHRISLAVAPVDRHASLATAAASANRTLALAAPDGSGLGASTSGAPFSNKAPSVESECARLYTSGTTGRPKGCILPNEYFLWAGHWYAGLGHLCEIRPGAERMITPLPFTHMNAMACSTMCMLLTGGCLVAVDRFHPRAWWDSVRESRATVMHYLGVMPAMLIASPPSTKDREHAVRFGFGAVSASRHAAFQDRFRLPLIEAWAMTETGCGAVVIANREPRRIGTACSGVRGAGGVPARAEDDVPLASRAASGPQPRCAAAIRLLRRIPGTSRQPLTPGAMTGSTPATWCGRDNRPAPPRRPQQNRPAQRREHIGDGGRRRAAAAPAVPPQVSRRCRTAAGDEVLACRARARIPGRAGDRHPGS